MQRRLTSIFNSFLLFASTSVYALANHDIFTSYLLVFIVCSVRIRSQAVSGSRLKLKKDHQGIL